jgi:opacity protein-like surface antigen
MTFMKTRLKQLLFLLILSTSTVDAGTYAGLSTSFINIGASTGSTRPVTVGINLGYAMDVHKLELVIMSSIKDDNLNQLVTDIPVASSLLYRFTANPRHSLHIDLILGYSQVEIESSYVNVPTFSETFSGLSWGVGLEEALESIPQLKFRADFIQLYRGDQLKINSFNVGVRYEF